MLITGRKMLILAAFIGIILGASVGCGGGGGGGGGIGTGGGTSTGGGTDTGGGSTTGGGTDTGGGSTTGGGTGGVPPRFPDNANYDVTLNGTANGHSFSVSGFFKITPRKVFAVGMDNNPRDFELGAGGVRNHPQPGSIMFVTNEWLVADFGLTPRTPKRNHADTSIDERLRSAHIAVRAPYSVYSTLWPPNIYAPGASTALPVPTIVGGSMDAIFNDDYSTVSGSVEFDGEDDFGHVSSYNATFSGTRS